jgi:type VI secretion system secreted protein Hcp
MPIYIQFSSIGGNVGKGQVYGMTQGTKTITPRNWKLTLEFQMAVEQPSGVATGPASGKRRHNPITITKAFEPATFHFFNFQAKNKVFPKLTLNFLKTNAQGFTVPSFTISLTNATVVSSAKAGAGRSREQYVTNESEEIKVTFQKIAGTWNDGGITASDDWLVG